MENLIDLKTSPLSLKRMTEKGLLPSTREEMDRWRKSFLGAFITKHPEHYGLILRIANIIGSVPQWESFTKLNIQAIKEGLMSSCSQSSVRTYLAMLKALLNSWKYEYEIPCKDFSKELSCKNVPSINIYLTTNEIHRLKQYNPCNKRENVILAQFLCACLTGARHSDVLKFDERNITDGMLAYVTQKTKTLVRVKAAKDLPRFLKIAQQKTYTDKYFNSTIREICRNVGICERVKVFKAGEYIQGEKWEFVSSHTARRSFATNLYLRGADLYSISVMMGHSSVEMTTKSYICCGLKPQSEKVLEYFK